MLLSSSSTGKLFDTDEVSDEVLMDDPAYEPFEDKLQLTPNGQLVMAFGGEVWVFTKAETDQIRETLK